MTLRHLQKGLFVLMMVTALFGTTFATHAAAPATIPNVAPPPNPPPQTPLQNDLYRLIWFYKPPWDGDIQVLIEEEFDQFILTKNDEVVRDTLANYASTPILQYIRSEAIHNPGSCTAMPNQNQAANRPGDFCWISQNHPDWFLRTSDGTRIPASNNYFLMDPGNAGWRTFWLERVIESQENLGWWGVFMDNVEASLEKREREGYLPARYPDHASYAAAIRGFLQHAYTSYFLPEGRPLYGNIVALRAPQTWFEYLSYLDGAMEEGWAVDWYSGYLQTTQWEEHMSRAEQTQAQSDQAILVSQGTEGDLRRQNFAYASYLLVTNGRASFRYANYRNYGEVWLYPNYDFDLGAPMGPRYRNGNYWQRDFTGGTVKVDPALGKAWISTWPSFHNNLVFAPTIWR